MILKLEEKYFLDLLYQSPDVYTGNNRERKGVHTDFLPTATACKVSCRGPWACSVGNVSPDTWAGLPEGNMSANSACNFAAADQRQMGLLGKHC